MKPTLLDLFSGAGGSAMGYYRAGFRVVGVDIAPQKNYPFEFHQDDAMEFCARYGKGFDAIHASPPCQAYSTMTKGRWKDRVHPLLIDDVKKILTETDRPFVIENVAGASKSLNGQVMLCGTMFGLQTKHGSQLRRHRLFYLSFPVSFLVQPCQHNNGSAIGVYGGGQNPARKRPSTIGVWGHAGGSSNRDGLIQFGIEDRKNAMGIDWMTGDELSEAISPAYTEFIGKYLLEVLQ